MFLLLHQPVTFYIQTKKRRLRTFLFLYNNNFGLISNTKFNPLLPKSDLQILPCPMPDDFTH